MPSVVSLGLLYLRCSQVTILDTGVRGMIAVGLVPQLYKLDHQPGWLPHSVAFHADDGKYVTRMVFFTYRPTVDGTCCQR